MSQRAQIAITLLTCTMWALLLASLAGRAVGSAPNNLLSNGSFTVREVNGSLASWTPIPASLKETTTTEDGQTLFTLKAADSHGQSGIQQAISVQPQWSRMLVRGYVRVRQAGASVDLAWRMKNTGQRVQAALPAWPDPTGGWVEINQLLTIPPDADQLIVTPQTTGAAGSADFRCLSVVAWVLTFDDEFDGSSVDSSRWTPTDTDHIQFQPGTEYFAPEHVTVANGVARFRAEHKPREGYEYQAGEIRTIGKFQQLYGYWEFRVRYPMTEGVWPAGYLLKDNDAWPPEIDIMESFGNVANQTVIESNHWADDYGRHTYSQVNFPATTIDRTTWHTYAICWEPESVAWYFDDVYKGTTGPPKAHASKDPMYLRFNMAITKSYGDMAKSKWPQDMECKFVHAYQRNDMPLPLYPEPSVEITLPANSATLSAISCNPMTGATAKWTQLEGPSQANIENPNALTSKATFSKSGMYRFNITVAKGASTNSRDLLVFVNPGPGRQ